MQVQIEKLEKACAPQGSVQATEHHEGATSASEGEDPSENQKKVVYEVPCKDCELKYIGETERSLKTRIVEHKYAVQRSDERNGIMVHEHKL